MEKDNIHVRSTCILNVIMNLVVGGGTNYRYSKCSYVNVHRT